ncbi:MAG TPA: hypothetical protein VGY54_09635 [Polyangiaceae bacterium]|jgi:hypothetical protein|nr:hypothetical protein [Polyangiaceae bacterium]
MSNESSLEFLQLSTQPRGNQADIDALRQWQRTGYVPMEYVQSQLKRGFSNGQTIMDLVLASVGPLQEDPAEETPPLSNTPKVV